MIRITFLILITMLAETICAADNLHDEMKRQYYTKMASKQTQSPEARIIWYDSLLSLPGANHTQLVLEQVKILRESGRSRIALDILTKLKGDMENRNLATQLDFKLEYASVLANNNDITQAIIVLREIIDTPKTGDLRIMDFRALISLFSIYQDYGDYTMANNLLCQASKLLQTLNLTFTERQIAESQLHGSLATMYLSQNDLEAAYLEIKRVKEINANESMQLAANIQMAQLYRRKGELNAAIEYLNEAISLPVNNDNKRSAIYEMTLCLLLKNDYRTAMKTLEEYPSKLIMENSLTNLRAYYIIKANVYSNQNQLLKAFLLLDSAIAVTDSIIQQTKKLQQHNALSYINLQRTLKASRSESSMLRAFCRSIGITLMVCVAALSLLFISYRKKRHLVNQLLIEQEKNSNLENSQTVETLNKRNSGMIMKLAHISNSIDRIKHTIASKTSSSEKIDIISRQLNDLNIKENIWEIFSLQFTENNRKFLDRLIGLHPNLSKTEQRICSFILINLSTKEIAELLDRSPRTIETTKYNIRKKLDIKEPTDVYLRRIANEAGQP